MHAIQVQAAMEGAASAVNSRSTSHTPSRAHSPDHLTYRQLPSELPGQASDNVAGFDPVNCAKSNEGGDYSEQEHVSRSPSPDGRAGTFHAGTVSHLEWSRKRIMSMICLQGQDEGPLLHMLLDRHMSISEHLSQAACTTALQSAAQGPLLPAWHLQWQPVCRQSTQGLFLLPPLQLHQQL